MVKIIDRYIEPKMKVIDGGCGSVFFCAKPKG
jgi:ribosomal protein L11 methylase PrmA